ncbi:MAG TPA: SpoIIE family protein phosphatase [Haliangium sp.]|nr:SpoIIE family protein phosphatase [Haliangium sp.]
MVPGHVSSLGAIADYVTAAAMEADLDQRAHYHLRLAVDEIATNVILHGYLEHGLQGQIELSARFDEQVVTVTIEDTAPAFDPGPALAAGATRQPLEERDEGGLGLLLVSRSVDAFWYERTDGKNRNVVEIRRAPAGAPAQPGHAPALAFAIAVPPAWRGPLDAAVDGLAGSVEWLHDAEALFAHLERTDPDLLLLALDLPAFPAEACLQKLRARHRDMLPPVVLLFDGSSEERLAACLDERVLDIVSMNLPVALARARLWRLIERVRLEAELRAARKRTAELETLHHDVTGIILPLGAALSKESDLDRLLERIVVEAMSICLADAGTLYLKAADDALRFSIMRTDSLGLALGGATGAPVPYAPLPLHDAGTGMPNHRNAATSAANTRRSINVPDVYDPRARFDFSGAQEFDRKLGYRTVSCLTVPLLAGGDLLGVLQMINARDASGAVIPFGAYQQQVIESLAWQAAIALQNHFLLHERESQLELERELQIGREIQSSFLPATLPEIPGWQLATHMQPARLVSGDFYDAFELAPGCFGLIIADVCDKGVGAALFMGLIRSLLRAFAQTSWRRGTKATARRRAMRQARRTQDERIDWLTRTLQRSVLWTNDYVANTHRDLDMFATLFFGVLEAESGLLLYTSCGHPPVLVVGASGVRAQLGPTGPALGVIPGADFRIEQAVIAPGELCFGYTDGVVDMRGRAGERFGSERLQRLLAPVPGSAQAAIDGLLEALRRHSNGAEVFDDMSMLSVLRAG